MKNYFFVLFLFLFVSTVKSQVVTGVYTGKMQVDSPKYTIDFELTLKEKDGKLVGYCQRIFIVDDVLYYNLLKVTARISDSVLILEDEKSVSNNFKEKTSGVKTVMFFKIQKNNDTINVMPGEWSTSRTKKFLPITGSVYMNRERNYLTTQLYKRLEDKKLATEMLFEDKPKTSIAATTTIIPTKPTAESVVTVATTKKQAEIGKNPITSENAVQSNKNNPISLTQPDLKNIAVQEKKTAVVNQQQILKDSVKTNPNTSAINKNNSSTTNPQQQNITGNNPTQQNTTIATIPNKPATTASVQQQTTVATTKPTITTVEKQATVSEGQTLKQSTINNVGSAVVDHNTTRPAGPSKQPIINNPVIIKRQTEIIDALELTGDSITLSLYDNGEIDGDTVSVFVNNELVVSKVGLRASAYKHTIAMQPAEIIQLTLFAENLGSIPPNTGLLVITTNNERYQVHFSSTLNKNASIVLRRKE